MNENFFDVVVEECENNKLKRFIIKLSCRVGYWERMSFGETNKLEGYHFKPFAKIASNVIYKVHRFLADHNLVCRGCEGPCFKKGKRRRRSTLYENDDLNYVFQCDECFAVEEDHWKEAWEEYNYSRW